MEAEAEAAPEATDRFYGGGGGEGGGLSTGRKLLKCISWDSQTNATPYVQVELNSKLHEINHFLKCKDSVKAKPGESNACLPVLMFCGLLAYWLVTNIKELKDSGCTGLVHEIGVLSSDRDAALLLIEMASHNVKETEEASCVIPGKPDDNIERVDNYSHPEKQLDVESAPEISSPSPEYEISDMPEPTFPL
ncbi:hypothetical protein ABZP36_012036 [Zizania latifolia]